jgi:Zn-dependent peptidase ImmA (M78 family)
VAAAFHHPSIGGSVLLAERSVPRMRFALAFALGHLVAARDEVVVETMGQARRKRPPARGFADAFATALLLPPRGLRERFAALHSEAGEVSDVAMLFLSRTFGVPLRKLRSRVEQMKLASPAALRRLDEALRRQRDELGGAGDPGPGLPDQARWEALPERYVFLAMRAFRKGLIDRGRLADCLGTTEGDTALRLLRYAASVSEPSGDEPTAH